MSRGWKSLEVHARESLECIEETVISVDMKGDFCESSEKREESSKESFCHLKKHIYHHGPNVARR